MTLRKLQWNKCFFVKSVWLLWVLMTPLLNCDLSRPEHGLYHAFNLQWLCGIKNSRVLYIFFQLTNLKLYREKKNQLRISVVCACTLSLLGSALCVVWMQMGLLGFEAAPYSGESWRPPEREMFMELCWCLKRQRWTVLSWTACMHLLCAVFCSSNS